LNSDEKNSLMTNREKPAGVKEKWCRVWLHQYRTALLAREVRLVKLIKLTRPS
jgi:hypothetical protein